MMRSISSGGQAVQPALEPHAFTLPIRWRRNPRLAGSVGDLLLVLALFLAWRVGLTVVTYLGSKLVPLVANGGPGAIGEGRSFDYWSSWAQWDGGFFLSIARDGYLLPDSPAFFPVYPAMARALAFFTGDYIFAGLLISHFAFLGFLVLFHRMVKARYGSNVALSATITYLSFPTAFFGVAMYSEALFLFFTVASLWSLERERVLPGAAFAGLAAGTRLVGIGTFLPVALYAVQRWPWRLRPAASYALAATLCLLPIGLYCLYLWRNFDNPLYFVEVVNRTWQRAPGDPFTTLIRYVNNPPNSTLHLVLEVTASFGFIAILALGFKRIPFSWWVYSLAVVLIPMSSELLVSMPRYVLASLGAFVIAGSVLADRKWLKWGVWGVSFALQAWLAIRFINGYWAA